MPIVQATRTCRLDTIENHTQHDKNNKAVQISTFSGCGYKIVFVFVPKFYI